jgi:hypothetical protein
LTLTTRDCWSHWSWYNGSPYFCEVLGYPKADRRIRQLEVDTGSSAATAHNAVTCVNAVLRGSAPTGFVGFLIPIVSLGMIRILGALKVLELPDGFSIAFVNRKPNYAEFGIAAACALAATLWTVIGIKSVSDTPLGAAVLVVPPVLLLIAMGIFVTRGLLCRNNRISDRDFY